MDHVSPKGIQRRFAANAQWAGGVRLVWGGDSIQNLPERKRGMGWGRDTQPYVSISSRYVREITSSPLWLYTKRAEIIVAPFPG